LEALQFLHLKKTFRFSITQAWSKNRQQPAGNKRKQPIKKPQPNQSQTRAKPESSNPQKDLSPEPKKQLKTQKASLKVATFATAKLAT
jgi:hypothetical protein